MGQHVASGHELPPAFVVWRTSAEEMDLARREWGAYVDLSFAHELGGDEAPSLPQIEVIIGTPSIDAIRYASNLRLVHLLTHGTDGFLTKEAREILRVRDVKVARSSASAISVAEYCIGAMISVTRRMLLVHAALGMHGDWSLHLRHRRMQGTWGGELFGSTLGIIGMGAIGRELASRATAMGMQVQVLSRNPRAREEREPTVNIAFPYANLGGFLASSDYVVVCVPLAENTANLLNQSTLPLMKRGSYLVNVSRAGVVDENAVFEGLEEGRLAGAVIDVWANEPRLAPLTGEVSDSRDDACEEDPASFTRFWNHNVLMTPHYSAATRESRTRSIQLVAQNLHRWRRGDDLQDQVRL